MNQAPWNRSRLDQLKKEGKIRGYSMPEETKTEPGRIVAKHFKKRSAEKEWLSWNLLFFANENCLTLKEEYRFDRDGRKWRADWAIEGVILTQGSPERKIRVLIEYEGIMSDISRHTTHKGYSDDTVKYNAAKKQGWLLLNYTASTYKNVLTDLREEFNK